jgi:hypothetical protein
LPWQAGGVLDILRLVPAHDNGSILPSVTGLPCSSGSIIAWACYFLNIFSNTDLERTIMKSNRPITRWLALAALATFSLQPLNAFAQVAAFTYQGQRTL